jgi:hypothetical protein
MRRIAVLVGLACVFPATAAAQSPYPQAASPIVWDSYPLASTHDHTSPRISLATILATPTINGLADDNAALMTATGRALFKRAHMKNGRMVVSIGTSPRDPQVVAWMREAYRHGWSVLIAPRRVAAQTVAPTPAFYQKWLSDFLEAWPVVSAIEASNEPEVTHLSPAQAAAYYFAAKRVAGKRRVLAGGFTDSGVPAAYFREYAKRTKATFYALHVYKNLWANRLDLLRKVIREVGAKRVWITESAAMTAYGDQTFTPIQQDAQAKRMARISRWKIVDRFYITGWESCDGCTPASLREDS